MTPKHQKQGIFYFQLHFLLKSSEKTVFQLSIMIARECPCTVLCIHCLRFIYVLGISSSVPVSGMRVAVGEFWFSMDFQQCLISQLVWHPLLALEGAAY